jgi:hypothetical protein
MSTRKYKYVLGLFGIVLVAAGVLWAAGGKDAERPRLTVRRVEDFEITGDGSAAAWNRASWVKLRKRPGGELPYDARFKMLYSGEGLYFLMEGSDAELTTTMEKDFMDLWTEDVFEVFLWTDERHPVYFEYEISPLGRELPIIIPNFEGEFYGWRPWHYEGERRTKKKTSATGGAIAPGARVKGWRAEFFIPYALLKPLQKVPPQSGTRWRANFYRVDYDGGKTTAWDWARVGPSFHEYKKFGTLEFE